MTGVPACPRCGYDQSGAIASWDTRAPASCPLHGTCSECGLTFWWHDVIHADRLIVRGFVEHARGFWQTWRWAWVTWAWTLWPPVFWRRVRMEHTPRIGVMLAWPILWAGVVFFAIASARSGSLAFDMMKPGATSATVAPLLIPPDWREALNPWTDWFAVFVPGTLRGAWQITRGPPVTLLLGLVANAVAMLILLVSPVTRKLAKVRHEHVVRAAVYGLSCTSVMWTGEVLSTWSAKRLFLFQLAWLTIWWGTATVQMFRERVSDGMIIAVVVASLLGAGLGASLTPRLVFLLSR